MTVENKKHIDSIISGAELSILLLTGKNIKLVPEGVLYKVPGDMREMMAVIAEGLGLTYDDYYEGRQPVYVDLRCIAALFLKRFYPDVLLMEIGELMGSMDHSSVLYMLERGKTKMRSDNMDIVFRKKYADTEAAVMNWIFKEVECVN